MYSYKYPRAALTVDSIVFVKEAACTKILLIERGIEPFKNKWALPGGFVNMDETLETACKRELEEETGLRLKTMQQFGTYDAINSDPRHRTISVVFSAQLNETTKVKGSDDATQASWFDIDNLPELAFDHLQIVSKFFKT